VYFGAITRYQNVAGSYIKKITVTRARSIIAHPQYNTGNKADDVALLELPEDAPIENNYVGLINLPKGLDRTRTLSGLQGTLSGFGELLNGKERSKKDINRIPGRTSDAPSVNAVLNYVTMPIVGNTVCSAYFGTNYVNNDHVCLQNNEGKSGCNGLVIICSISNSFKIF
jgi:hypothetical protein